MTTENSRRPRGFTLVELLVVIAIIGILAAILIPTLYRVVIKARQTKIAVELTELSKSIESYKQKFGDYPPDCTTLTALTDLSNANHLVVRHLRKAFPRHAENLTTAFDDGSGGLKKPDPGECLVYWLSQMWDDPRQPLTGSGNRVKLFEFDEKRLVDPGPNESAADGFYHYIPPDGKDTPYVYFDSRVYTHSTAATAALCVYKDSSSNALVYPYRAQKSPSASSDWANKTTFQIISAGLDGEYGDVSGVTAGTASTYKVFPIGTNYKIGDMDNIANFSDGKILEDFLE